MSRDGGGLRVRVKTARKRTAQSTRWLERQLNDPYVKRAKADLQKCGLCERKLLGSTYKLVKLQRPPPDIRIFLPALLAWSSSSTWRPRAAALKAHIKPAAPAPMITTSWLTPMSSAWG